LYVSGQKDCIPGSSIGEEQLKGDLRFAELLSEFIGSIRQVRFLSKQQASLAQFFPPQVLENLRQSDAEQRLEPKEDNITVLFCDVRGFAKKAEESQENLRVLLDRVSDALGVMTTGILKYDGVIADFQGDAALGFWGWPASNEDDRLSACKAALHIQQEFQFARNTPGHSLSGFQVGIGLAHGRAIAGKIGTVEQIKVGAFGPPVNLGARLEGLTKTLGVSILMDEGTADYARETLAPSEGRLRRMGFFQPAGLHQALLLTQLLPPVEADPTVSDADIALYERALDLFMAGQWREALEQFQRLPEHGHQRGYVAQYITDHHCKPPAGWDGVIVMQSK
jgi:adenylate cyclase